MRCCGGTAAARQSHGREDFVDVEVFPRRRLSKLPQATIRRSCPAARRRAVQLAATNPVGVKGHGIAATGRRRGADGLDPLEEDRLGAGESLVSACAVATGQRARWAR